MVYIMTFWIVTLRDIGTLLITVYFCWRVNRNFAGSAPNITQIESADPSLLNDFEMLLWSNLPHKFFTDYLQHEKPAFT
jgi:hypothetical protein